MHEASLYERNCFITVTYSDEHLPKYGTLVKRDFQLFMKRLRKEFGSGVRYYMCGEYGDRGQRPHYHACLFNFDFADKVCIRENEMGKLCFSEDLARIWGKGHCTVGDVTFESAAYVARYILKKQSGPNSVFVYNEVDNRTGEILSERIKEYTTMSRRPGIGRGWFEKFASDVFPRDFVVVRGQRASVPKYYGGIFEVDNPRVMQQVKDKREAEREKQEEKLWLDSSPSRLATREFVQLEAIKQLIRSIE